MGAFPSTVNASEFINMKFIVLYLYLYASMLPAFKDLTVYQTIHCALSAFHNITHSLVLSNTPILAVTIQPE